MNCPKCKEQNLKKQSGFDSPFGCPRCGGMWLEYDNLPRFIENLDISARAQGEEPNLNDDTTGLCPAGHGIMLRAKIEVDNPFFLEKCGACGGIWFDNGELQRIINNQLTDAINDFWCRSWQAKQRKEKTRRTYLETNRKLLGDALFHDLMNIVEQLKSHPDKGRALALLQHEILK